MFTLAANWIQVSGWAFLAAGVILLIKGLWPRRRGSTRHCRQCDYVLTGLPGPICPECGTSILKVPPVHGELWRNRKLIFVGLLTVALCPGWFAATHYLRQVNWYRHYPDNWLLSDLKKNEWGYTGVSEKAWTEATRRINSAQAGSALRSGVVSVALNKQANYETEWTVRAMCNVLGKLLIDGMLTNEQAGQFIEHSVVAELRSRKFVIQGDPVPLEEIEWSRIPDLPFCVEIKRGGLWLDGELVHSEEDSCVIAPNNYNMKTRLISCDAPGRHQVETEISYRLLLSAGYKSVHPLPKETDSRWVKKKLTSQFEVVESTANHDIRLIESQSSATAQQLFEQYTPIPGVTSRAYPDRYDIHVGFYIDRYVPPPPPVNLAMDVIARTMGREFYLGTLLVPSQNNYAWKHPWLWRPLCDQRFGFVWRYPDSSERFARFDVVLRPTKEAAKRTVDLYTIWGEELVYPDLTVDLEPPKTQRAEPHWYLW